MRSQKGITLIALVITIIVLLILAGVSIAMLTGQNGILTRATDAKEDTAVAEAVERINMELNAAYALILSGDITGTTFSAEDIDKVQANLPDDYTADGDGTATLTITPPDGITLAEGGSVKITAAGKATYTPAKANS